MPEYIDLEIATDVETLQDDAMTYLEDAVPGWEAAPGNLETILIEAISAMASEQALIASQVPVAIFRYFGQELLGLPPIEGVQASGSTTWTLIDTLGHTIAAGTLLSIGEVVFTVAGDTTVAAGSTSAEVPILAAEPGTFANDVSGTPQLIDTLAFVSAITLDGTTSGGIDPETDDEYLNRLVEELQIMAPRPIVPTDFEVLACRIAGVDRAVAIDGFNPADSTYNNERMVAVACVDENGEAVSSTIKTQVHDYLDSLREVNFVVNVIDPTYTPIDIDTEIAVLPDFDQTATQDAVTAALTDFLDPANWGRQAGVDPLIGRNWTNTPVVGEYNVAEVIKGVSGVAYVNSPLTLSGGSVAPGPGVGRQLAGAAPLTRAGTITVTIGALP